MIQKCFEKKQKNNYKQPVVDIIKLNYDDVIATSCAGPDSLQHKNNMSINF